MNDLCELAGTGASQYSLLILAAVIFFMVVIFGKKANRLYVVVALFGLAAFGSTDMALAQQNCDSPTGSTPIVTSPDDPEDGGPQGPSPIEGLASQFVDITCGALPADSFTLDLMDGTFFSTSGSGSLLSDSIDLDTVTPGRQTSVTVLSEAGGGIHVTYSVDGSGMLSMIQPTTSGVPGGSNEFIMEFTIEDEDGYISSPASFSYLYDRDMCE